MEEDNRDYCLERGMLPSYSLVKTVCVTVLNRDRRSYKYLVWYKPQSYSTLVISPNVLRNLLRRPTHVVSIHGGTIPDKASRVHVRNSVVMNICAAEAHSMLNASKGIPPTMIIITRPVWEPRTARRAIQTPGSVIVACEGVDLDVVGKRVVIGDKLHRRSGIVMNKVQCGGRVRKRIFRYVRSRGLDHGGSGCVAAVVAADNAFRNYDSTSIAKCHVVKDVGDQ